MISIKIGFHGVLERQMKIYQSKITKIIHKFCSTPKFYSGVCMEILQIRLTKYRSRSYQEQIGLKYNLRLYSETLDGKMFQQKINVQGQWKRQALPKYLMLERIFNKIFLLFCLSSATASEVKSGVVPKRHVYTFPYLATASMCDFARNCLPLCDAHLKTIAIP